MELGQWLFQGSEMHEFEAYWATDGLVFLGDEIEKRYPEYQSLGGNYGGDQFENDTFIMKNYCWCDGDREGHEEGCPPNFVHKPTNLIITWYKHCGRGITANQELTYLEWSKIVENCTQSLEDK